MGAITETYASASKEVQLKAPLLQAALVIALVLVAMLLGSLALVTFTWVRLVGTFALGLVTLMSLRKLRAGNYAWASTVFFSLVLTILAAMRLFDISTGSSIVFAPNVMFLGAVLVVTGVFVSTRALFWLSGLVLCSLLVGANIFIVQGNLEKTPDALAFEIVYPGVAIVALITGVIMSRKIFDKASASVLESLDLVRRQNAVVQRKNQAAQRLIEDSAGHMARADEMLDNSKETASAAAQITGHLRVMEGRIDELNEKVRNTNASLAELDEVIEQLQNTAENQASHTVESSAVVEQMVESIQAVARIASEKEALIADLKRKARAGRTQLDDMATVFEGVSGHLSTIDQVTNIISGIARQTHLLALNASIEAAHAGHSGRGFAVVAAEIRNLASGAASSAEQISSRVDELRRAIAASGNSIESTGTSFDAIQIEVSGVAHAMQEIVGSMKELSLGSQGMLSAMQGLQDGIEVVREVVARAHDMHEVIRHNEEDVSLNSQELADGIRDIAEDIHRIGDAIGRIFDMSKDLKKRSLELFDSVKRDALEQSEAA